MSFEDTLAALLDERIAPLRADLERVVAELAAARRTPAALPDEVLTVAEGARAAKVSTKTIRAACAGGALQARKPDGCAEWRFTRAALLAWLQPPSSPGRGPAMRLDSEAGPRQAVAKLLRGAR